MIPLNRRDFLLAGAAAAGGLAVRPSRAVAASAAFDGEIRVLGIGYDRIDAILERAHRDLGFRVVSRIEDPPVIQRLVRQQPASFDIFSCFSQDAAQFWATGNLQPVEIAKLHRWREVSPLYKLGRAQPRTRCAYGQGDAGFRRLYVDPDRSGRWRSAPRVPAEVQGLLVQWFDESTGKTVGPEPSFCTGSPGTFNFDSFGYRADILKKRPEQLSWAELLNRRWRRRVALISDYVVGLQDTGHAVQAVGLMRFGDLTNPTRSEIDRLVKLLLRYKKQGQFFNLWAQFGDLIKWMQAGQVVVGSAFAVQIAALAALKVPVRQAAPREGYRAFAGLVSISSEVREPRKLDACYAYLNWLHSGFAAAKLLQEGYYSAVQGTSRRFMAPGEYAYWIEGKPADRAYAGPFGDTSVRKGQVRDGGSLVQRACRISSWNTTATQDSHLFERWQQFTSTF
jgi:putative spermidine/putrescine transport system substrate-binding protein